MAQLLQPLFVLVLIITLICQHRGVKCLEHMDYQSLLDIKNSMTQNQLKEIWSNDYKHLVKNIDPGLLRSRKRGRRGGVRVNHSNKHGRVPLPAVVLTNARSIRNKLDELHGLLNTKRLRNQSQLICITESWLSPDILTSRTELQGYEQFRNDRQPASSGKSCGGGILVYIDNKWSTNNNIIYNHTDNHCEILTIKSRPHWLPREFSSIISVSCYTPFTGNSRLKQNATATAKTIATHVKDLEKNHPNSCIMVMGDFNQLPFKLDGYYQVVKTPTRNNRILDKCYLRIKDAFKHCHQLSKLGDSDHYVTHLIPTYTPLSKYKPTRVTRRIYSEENCDNLKAAFDITIWDNLLSDDDSIHKQTEIITDYINFCTDLCIPKKSFRMCTNQKPWMSKHISKMLEQKQLAHDNGNRKLYNKLKRDISKAITVAKKDYSTKIQQQLAREPAKAWTDIKKISGLPSNTNTTTKQNPFAANDLNTFFARYEKPVTEQPVINNNNTSAPPIEIKEDIILKQLNGLNSRKGPGPDGLIPKVLKFCSYQLAPIITQLFRSSIDSKTTPNSWKSAIIKPLPKVKTPEHLKQYRPIALTSCLCKMMERLIKHYIVTNTTMDKYQFAYRAKRSTQDALLCLTTTITNFIDQRASNYARCLFLDFSSAFNTIHVPDLISELSHLDSSVTEWIYSFLSNRVQRTIVDGKLSNPITTNTGTPQGCCLSPLLFSIYTNRITSNLSNVTVIKYADDTCIIGCIANQSDLCTYFDEINRIARQCDELNLLLNPTKTQEMLFSTQYCKPCTPDLVLNNTTIVLTEKVKYLGVIVDDKLRFQEHVQSAVSTASKRMYIVKNFVFFSSKSLSNMLFKSFIVSLICYCLPTIFTCLYASDKKSLRKLFKDAAKLGIEHPDIDTLIADQTKTLALRYIHDDDHFINDFLSKCPSGRFRTVKHRTMWGRDCFLRHLIHVLNDALF